MTTPHPTYHGVLPLYKKSGPTSHDAVDAVRRILRQRSVGHAGTLDPAAEGLLVVLLGKATKVARFLTSERKRYRAEITLGRESSTYDAEGVDWSSPIAAIPKLGSEELESVLDEFRGDIKQQVPAFSAVQVDGERLYSKARRGQKLERPVREVTIYSLNVASFDGERLTLDVDCSSGTYIRSLAHDLGQKLGCGGYLSHLTRTACGRLTVEEAVTIEELEAANESGEIESHVLSIGKALGFSAVTVTEGFSTRVRDGGRPAAADILRLNGGFAVGDHLLVMDPRGTVMAVGTAEVSSTQLTGQRGAILRYERVLA